MNHPVTSGRCEAFSVSVNVLRGMIALSSPSMWHSMVHIMLERIKHNGQFRPSVFLISLKVFSCVHFPSFTFFYSHPKRVRITILYFNNVVTWVMVVLRVPRAT